MFLLFLLFIFSQIFSFCFSATVVEQTPLGQSLIVYCSKSGINPQTVLQPLETMTQQLTTASDDTPLALTQAWWGLLNCWYKNKKDWGHVSSAANKVTSVATGLANQAFSQKIRDKMSFVLNVFASYKEKRGSVHRFLLAGLLSVVVCVCVGSYFLTRKRSQVAERADGQIAPGTSRRSPGTRPWVCPGPLSPEERAAIDGAVAQCVQNIVPDTRNLPHIDVAGHNDLHLWMQNHSSSVEHFLYWLQLAYPTNAHRCFQNMLQDLCVMQASHMPPLSPKSVSLMQGHWQQQEQIVLDSRYLNAFLSALVQQCLHVFPEQNTEHSGVQSFLPVVTVDERIKNDVGRKMKRVVPPCSPDRVARLFAHHSDVVQRHMAETLARAVIQYEAHLQRGGSLEGSLHRTAALLSSTGMKHYVSALKWLNHGSHLPDSSEERA